MKIDFLNSTAYLSIDQARQWFDASPPTPNRAYVLNVKVFMRPSKQNLRKSLQEADKSTHRFEGECDTALQE